MHKLKEFSSSVPDFRRSGKGNLRHRLDDIIILMILGRASGCIGRAEIIEFGRHNLNKFSKIGMLRNGALSEATLYRMDDGIDDLTMADRMS
ncbi:MAG: transposase family protein [Bacteroides caccae]